MKFGEKTGFIVLGVVCLLFAALRFWHLTDSCLWFDEIFTVHAAEMSFSSLLWFVAQDLIHPPLSYILLKIWIAIGGESLFWLRCFPVFFAILALYPLVRFCRALKLDYGAISAAVLFLAVNGCLIKYAQEVRMYSLFFFLALVSMWLFARFLQMGKNIWILSIVNVLLVYTHYFGWFLILSEIAAILVLQRIKFRQMMIMFGICLAGFAPWIFAVWRAAEINAGVEQNIGWIGKPDFRALFELLFDLIEPFYFQQASNEAPSLYALTIPVAMLVVTAFVMYLVDRKEEFKEEKQNLILLTIFAALPVLLAVAASWILPYSIFGTRHLIFVFAPFAILISIAVTKIKAAPVVGTFLVLFAVLFGVAFYVQSRRAAPVYIWCGWENLAEKLDKTQKAKIYAFEDVVAYDLWFALREREQNFEIFKVEGVGDMPEDKAYFLPRGFTGVEKTDENGIAGERFYVAYRDSSFSEFHPPLRNLKAKGYRIGKPFEFETPGLKAFLVEVWK